ncbi:MAG: hypothetical protein NVS1B2_02240 [Vulcanimicrobiaceae bacterium]
MTTNLGPDYVAALVDALMTSPAGYWNDTALFVTWDDPGGWYDHVSPPQLDRNGLGFCVPLSGRVEICEARVRLARPTRGRQFA